MNNESLPLELEVQVKNLEFYLNSNPQEASRLAITNFKKYLVASQKNQELEKQKKLPSLPPIPPPSLGRLQAKYDDLREQYIKVLTDNHHLRHQVKELIELACALSDEDAELPSFLKKAFDL